MITYEWHKFFRSKRKGYGKQCGSGLVIEAYYHAHMVISQAPATTAKAIKSLFCRPCCREDIFSSSSWCRKRDSNPRPTDYKSVALPTELFRHTAPFIHLFLADANGNLSRQKILPQEEVPKRDQQLHAG